MRLGTDGTKPQTDSIGSTVLANAFNIIPSRTQSSSISCSHSLQMQGVKVRLYPDFTTCHRFKIIRFRCSFLAFISRHPSVKDWKHTLLLPFVCKSLAHEGHPNRCDPTSPSNSRGNWYVLTISIATIQEGHIASL
jgi:hypothetical protein